MDILQILGIVAGCLLGVAGLWMLRNAKRTIHEPGSQESSSDTDESPELGLSIPTRLAIGITIMIVGYHLIAWSVPRPMYGVPIGRWWMVLGIGVLVVGGAFFADRVERLKGI